MDLMQVILLSTVNAILCAFFVGVLTYTLVERPDVREELLRVVQGGLYFALLGAVAVMLLSLGS
ncbi:MAG: hypothetical protein EB165_06390 [Euryarchaeota archaeon]|nr:hypothetical protein [Euryarchaeota archaeon]NDB94253.1 hypothetical protein [Euryarchaeota archaeon]